jgi:D-serine dehydratase
VIEGGDVDVPALRELTSDSGGRTEIIRSAADLSPATSGIADELSRQYFLGYQGAAARDGRWHTIEVTVRQADVRVRARTGYFAGEQRPDGTSGPRR